ncbi:MAG: DHH family phosphoesterase [Oscillospiraceae bacterium]|nr:DHH family phosphoesterase [Oscillospiraceae bacterium]
MNYRECANYLRQRDRFLLLTHKNPDGDTVCSASALCSALRRLGKEAYLYPNPDVIRKMLPYAEPYFAPAGCVPDCIVSVDVATENLFPRGFAGKVELCIDHHPTNTHFAGQELIRAEKSSCGEIVLDLIKSLCGDVTPEEATMLYVAVTTDTGCFQYANTSYQTLGAGAELLRLGADGYAVTQAFFRKASAARIMLEGMIYSGMGFYRGGKVVVATVTRAMMDAAGATEDDCDDLAGLSGRVEDCDINVTIRELADGGSKISVRSVPGVSSSEICAAFGGGGHDMAAGCTIQCPPEKAKEMLLAVIDEVYR